MNKVLIPQTIDELGISYLRDKGYAVVRGSGWDNATLKREIADADAVICRLEEYSPDVIDAAKRVKILARYGVGYENVDAAYAESQGIIVTNTPGGNSQAVAEHAFSLMLACAKHTCYFDAQIRKGRWKEMRGSQPSLELFEKMLGIIGLGAIGMAVAKIGALGFGMRVVACDAYICPAAVPEYIAMEPDIGRVFAAADYLTLHVPSNAETENTIRRETLRMMKPSAVLVNCSRGPVVNEDDLYEALVNHTIAAAGCDVLKNEPVARHGLFSLPQFVVSPHIGGLTREADAKIALSAARAVDDVLSGRSPQHPVTFPKKPRAVIAP